MKTRTIAGHEITLQEGKRYMAGRPFATATRKVFPVRIDRIDEFGVLNVKIIPNLTYDQANEFINAFNNDPRGSLYGREW